MIAFEVFEQLFILFVHRQVQATFLCIQQQSSSQGYILFTARHTDSIAYCHEPSNITTLWHSDAHHRINQWRDQVLVCLVNPNVWHK
jgi:hypothetical protein